MELSTLNIFKSQFFKNTAWTITDVVSYPLVMILATPFFIRQLGAEQYGLWMLINVIVQTMNALNFGLGDSTIKEVSKNNAIGNFEQLNKTFNRNYSLAIILACCCYILGAISSKLISANNWFNISAVDMPKAMLTLLLFSLLAGFKFIELVFIAVFKGLQRFDIAAKLAMLSRLSILFSSIIVVYNGGDILTIVKTSLVVSILNILIQAFMLMYRSPINSLIPKFKHIRLNEILQNNGWYWLQSVIALLGFLSDRLLIGHLSNLKTVGYYSIAALIGSQIHNVLLTLGTFIFPKVAANHALNKNSSNIYFLSRFFIAGLGWLTVLLLILFGDSIFNWWLGEAIYKEAYQYIKLYLGFTAVIILIIVPFHFINGSQYVKINSLFEIVLRSSHVISMWIAFHYFGMEGLLWSLIITTIINIPFQYFIFNKLILNQFSFKEAFYPIVPALAIVLLAISTSNWLNIVLISITIITFKLIYYDNVKSQIKQLIIKKNE